jgi:hypothetical protein
MTAQISMELISPIARNLVVEAGRKCACPAEDFL